MRGGLHTLCDLDEKKNEHKGICSSNYYIS